jgi:orotidine-5'-phosphate decarboxylase
MTLCVALDLPSADENLILAKKIKFFNIWVKVGLRTYIRDGQSFLKELKKINPNFKIFLDLKLYDIPNTMADASEEISKLNIDMFNIHASAGKEAMSIVMKRIKNIPNRPLVIAVTALTSFDNNNFKNIYGNSINKKVTQFTKDAFKAGLDGVVCSAFESLEIKNNTNKEFITLAPAIRPYGEDLDDQIRVATVELAKKELVDFIVIGRPIYKSKNPITVIKSILKKL